MYRTLKIVFVFFMMHLGMQQRSYAQTGGEANLKAVFIYNFTRYIEWDTASNLDKNNFVIGVLGSTPVSSALSEVARTNRVNNKRIVIRRYSKPEEIENCHILFIPKGIPFSLPSVLQRTQRGTLTVSEDVGFARQGVALNFVINNDKLKFEVNLKSLYDAGLKASSQLLKLAVIVD